MIVFIYSVQGGPITLQVTKDSMTPRLYSGFLGMCEGERRSLTMTPDMAFQLFGVAAANIPKGNNYINLFIFM